MAYRTDVRDAERVGKDTSPSLPASLWLGLRGVHKLVIVNAYSTQKAIVTTRSSHFSRTKNERKLLL